MSNTDVLEVFIDDGNDGLSTASQGSPGSAVPSYALQAAGKDGSGNLRALSVDTAGVVDICIEKVADSTISLGQKTAANSFPVIPASDANLAKETGGNLATLVANLPTKGSNTMANSQPVTLASDQPAFETVSPFILSPLTTHKYSATGASSAIQVVPGAWYAMTVCVDSITAATSTASCTTTTGSRVMTTATTGSAAAGQAITGTNIPTGAFITSVVTNTSITINVPCTGSATNTMTFTTNSFNVNFETSPDNSAWSSVSAIPQTLTQLRAPVTGTAQAGLYLVQAPANSSGVCYLRFNVTALSNATLQLFCDPFTPGQRINLPLFYTATQANWSQGCCWIPPVDTSYLANITLDVLAFAGTGQTFTPYQSNDPFLSATQQGCAINTTNTNTGSAAVSFTAAGIYTLLPKAKYLFAKETGTAISSLTLGGLTAVVSNTDSIPLTPGYTPTNIAQVGGNSTIAPSPQGASNVRSLAVNITGAANGTMTTTAFAGNGRTSGAAQAFSSDGGGTMMAFDINASTVTLGTASAVQFGVECSVDNGTTWSTIYVGDSITTTGHIYIPPLAVFGRVRTFANSFGGTSTTVTTATNYMAYPSTGQIIRRLVDIYNATNATNTINNGVTSTSTLVSTTLSSTSAILNIEGCKLISISGVFSGGTPGTAPVYTLQVSNDTTNWISTSASFSPSAAGTFGAVMSNSCWRYARLIISTASATGTPYTVAKTEIYGTN
jgi:hypothetical protein